MCKNRPLGSTPVPAEASSPMLLEPLLGPWTPSGPQPAVMDLIDRYRELVACLNTASSEDLEVLNRELEATVTAIVTTPVHTVREAAAKIQWLIDDDTLRAMELDDPHILPRLVRELEAL
jgi:hypothetical protein